MDQAGFEERLTAILAADAVGYSRLMAADQRATLAALDAARAVFRRQVELHHGRVIDTAGDSVLASFATATGAVRAAIECQQDLAAACEGLPAERQMRFRIGVHLGDVIVKPDGTVYGTGVNVAARLQALAQPGGICVSDAMRTAVRDQLTASFADLGDHAVKNIAAPIRAYSLASVALAHLTEGDPQDGAAAIADLLPLPDKPSIAVLPFTNMSGDPEQEYFTDGITEDIITELSRFHFLFVIARNSSFSYKGRSVDVRTVARELGVRYVLEGSIRRGGQRIRVTAQLIDAGSGNHIWAERYDRLLEEIFDVQEEVTSAIVSAIAPHIEAHEANRARRPRPGNMTAYEKAMRAWGTAQLAFMEADSAGLREAIRLAREALAIDERSSVALRSIAQALWYQLTLGIADSAKQARDEAMQAVVRAIAIDSSDDRAHYLKGTLLCAHFGDSERAAGLIDLRQAHELNPNDARVLSLLGLFEATNGDAVAGLEHTTQALRLSPRGPGRPVMLAAAAWAHFASADYQKAAEVAQRSVGEAPTFSTALLCLAASLAGSGRVEEAASAYQRVAAAAPELAKARVGGQWMFSGECGKRATLLLRIAAGLEDPGAAPALVSASPRSDDARTS